MSGFDRLLRPKSIAIVGGGAWCENVLIQCEKIGFAGPIWPIHPKKDQIAGRDTYASLCDLPAAPDATFIGVNRQATVEVVRELSVIGAGGAICFASGFLEAQNESADGADLQDQLIDAAGSMKIIGPNCYGLVNYLDGVALWPDQHGGVICESGVAIITQSSNIAINLTMQKRGLPISYVVTAGNQAQTGLSEIGAAMLEDPRVTALGLHIEGIDDLRAFERLAKRANQLKKGIIALKVGASEQAQSATISHTASLAGSDAGADALLKRLGIGRVSNLSAFLETLKLLHVSGPLETGKIASLSCSGGEASLFADSIANTQLTLPKLTSQQRSALRKALGPMVALANPLDYHTYIWANTDAMTQTFAAIMDPSLSMVCVVVDFPRIDRCSASDWDTVIEAAEAAVKAEGIPMALVATLAENMPEVVADKIIDMGLVPFCGLTEAIEAMDVAAGMGLPKMASVLLPKVSSGETTLSEFEAKRLLGNFGIATPDNKTALRKDLSEAATQMNFPVVLKGEGFAHKSDAGAVKLGLQNVEDVLEAAADIAADSFLIEEMISGSICELLIGVIRDDAHGYVLTVAAGGIMTEILQDRASLLIPASRDDVAEAILSLKIAPVVKGFRGHRPANLDAIVDAVMGLQLLAETHSIVEAEINPLMCTCDRAIACDALIKIGQPT